MYRKAPHAYERISYHHSEESEIRSMAVNDEARWRTLMLLTQQGEKESYSLLLSELIPIIDEFVTSRCGILGDTEEIKQQCLRTVHKARMSYTPTQPFYSWLLSILRYCIIANLHRLPKTDSVRIQTDYDTPFFSSALQRLPTHYSHVLRLTIFTTDPTRKIAEKLGLTERKLLQQCSRAMKLLRNIIGKMLRELR